MWNKSFAGFFCGWLCIVLVPGAFVQLNEQLANVMIAVLILIGLSAWAGIMTYCYAAATGKEAWKRGGKLLLPCAVFYAVSVLIGGLQ